MHFDFRTKASDKWEGVVIFILKNFPYADSERSMYLGSGGQVVSGGWWVIGYCSPLVKTKSSALDFDLDQAEQ